MKKHWVIYKNQYTIEFFFGRKIVNNSEAPNYIMAITLEKLIDRLHFLENEHLPNIIKEKAHAYEQGGTHDNAGWETAVNEERIIYNEIYKIKERIKDPIIIEGLEIYTSKVSIGSQVKVQNTSTQDIFSFVIVGPNERITSNDEIEYVSNISPIAQAMLGKKIGEKFRFGLPSGALIEYAILDIQNHFQISD